ncbi:MAG: serine hydrolase [Oligoflexus sp.]
MIYRWIFLSSMLVSQIACAKDLIGLNLENVLEQRFLNDRTGACIAAGMIEGKQVGKAFFCADPNQSRSHDSSSRFEIGSITKPMLGILWAKEIEQGHFSLDTPLTDLLPKGVSVPGFAGQPILMKHLLTHTSGLPSIPAQMQLIDPQDPYASITEEQLLASLSDINLSYAPGEMFSYSNFGAILLSWAYSSYRQRPFDELIKEELFAPLNMNQAGIGGDAVQGHMSTGQATSWWNFPTNMAGVGGVRASLDDMLKFSQAYLDQNPVIPERTRDIILQTSSGNILGWFWMHIPYQDSTIMIHEGGTGGFSSLVAIHHESERAVVLLSDTSLSNLQGLSSVALHLFRITADPGKPRLPAKPSESLLQSLQGEYILQGGMKVSLSVENGALWIQAEGQERLQLLYDSHGDFYPLELDALLRPLATESGYEFIWFQGGGAIPADRLD